MFFPCSKIIQDLGDLSARAKLHQRKLYLNIQPTSGASLRVSQDPEAFDRIKSCMAKFARNAITV
jgi:hypothetical protein